MEHIKLRATKDIMKEIKLREEAMWWSRSTCLDKKKKSGYSKLVEKEERRVKKSNKFAKHMDDFEWGMLCGQRDALQWAIGFKWGMLDT